MRTDITGDVKIIKRIWAASSIHYKMRRTFILNIMTLPNQQNSPPIDFLGLIQYIFVAGLSDW